MRLILVVLAATLAVPVLAQDGLTPEEGKILDELKNTPVGFVADLPSGVPDPRPWEGITNQLALRFSKLHTGLSANQNEVPKLLIDSGLCPDNDDPCYVALRYEFSVLRVSGEENSKTVMRYAFRSNRGMHLEILCSGIEPSDGKQAGTFSYWLRSNKTWELQKGPAYQRVDKAFWFFANFVLSSDRGPMNQPRPKSTPAPGQIAS